LETLAGPRVNGFVWSNYAGVLFMQQITAGIQIMSKTNIKTPADVTTCSQ